jgi:hypothetical protein
MKPRHWFFLQGQLLVGIVTDFPARDGPVNNATGQPLRAFFRKSLPWNNLRHHPKEALTNCLAVARIVWFL